MSRIGQRLLAIGGFCLAALMAYTVVLSLGFENSGEDDSQTPMIAVVLPERVYWRDFREGIRICENQQLLRIVEETDLTIVVESLESKRRLGFEWYGVRGEIAMKEEVESLLEESPRPPAIIGSSNTVLTHSIATTLANPNDPGAQNLPLLLIPLASAVLTERSEPGETPVGLLDIHPGRTFRFCLNNQAQANLLVSCLLNRRSKSTVDKVILIEDRQDPYSSDLVDSFHRAIERMVPGVAIDERSLDVSISVDSATAGPGHSPDDALAASIYADVEKLSKNRSLWVVLPIHEEPARRMIEALGRQARRDIGKDSASIEVLTGDSIPLELLESLAGRLPFPLMSVSTNSPTNLPRELAKDFSADSQIPAEIVSSLILALDQLGENPLTPQALRKQLEAIDWAQNDPRAIGRTLRFAKSGERISDDLGHVLTILPDDPRVHEIPSLGKNRWGSPVPLDSARLTNQR